MGGLLRVLHLGLAISDKTSKYLEQSKRLVWEASLTLECRRREKNMELSTWHAS